MIIQAIRQLVFASLLAMPLAFVACATDVGDESESTEEELDEEEFAEEEIGEAADALRPREDSCPSGTHWCPFSRSCQSDELKCPGE